MFDKRGLPFSAKQQAIGYRIGFGSFYTVEKKIRREREIVSSEK